MFAAIKQVQTLRDLGDRNIYEFTLSKDGKMQKVGDIELTLKGEAPCRQPLFWPTISALKRWGYQRTGFSSITPKAHRLTRLVVNKVNKNQIVGYLATPKVTLARNEAAAQ